MSAIRDAKDMMFVDSSTDKYLISLGGNYGVPPPASDPNNEDLYREIIKLLSVADKNTYRVMYQLLEIVFGTQASFEERSWAVYQPAANRLVIEIPNSLVASAWPRSMYLRGYGGSEAWTSGSASTSGQIYVIDETSDLSTQNLVGLTLRLNGVAFTIASITYSVPGAPIVLSFAPLVDDIANADNWTTPTWFEVTGFGLTPNALAGGTFRDWEGNTATIVSNTATRITFSSPTAIPLGEIQLDKASPIIPYGPGSRVTIVQTPRVTWIGGYILGEHELPKLIIAVNPAGKTIDTATPWTEIGGGNYVVAGAFGPDPAWWDRKPLYPFTVTLPASTGPTGVTSKLNRVTVTPAASVPNSLVGGQWHIEYPTTTGSYLVNNNTVPGVQVNDQTTTLTGAAKVEIVLQYMKYVKAVGVKLEIVRVAD